MPELPVLLIFIRLTRLLNALLLNILEILFKIDKDITVGSLIVVEGTRLRICAIIQ